MKAKNWDKSFQNYTPAYLWIKLAEGKSYRLLKSMNLPKMSTTNPRFKSKKTPKFSPENLLKQEFKSKSPNQV